MAIYEFAFFPYNSYKDAYKEAELVVLGRVISVEVVSTKHFLTWEVITYTLSRLKVELVIKGESPTGIITLSQTGGIEEEGIYCVVIEDPPLEVGEGVILFLNGNGGSPPDNLYCYPGMFGRFEVVDGKVYSMMHEAPGLKLLEKYGLPKQKRIESASILAGMDYVNVNGIPLEEFIETLTAP
ncbi:MAG: hypothetical protein QXW09_00950 [Thermoproteota archaeon]